MSGRKNILRRDQRATAIVLDRVRILIVCVVVLVSQSDHIRKFPALGLHAVEDVKLHLVFPIHGLANGPDLVLVLSTR